jgi:hypothetical protein
MTLSHTATARQRSLLLLLFVGLLLGSASPATAQSVDAVIENMRTQYEEQLETVDTYIIETNLYTSYSKKVMRDGEPSYETQTKMKGQGGSSFASSTTPSSAYGLQFDRLKEHATYAGTESIDGVRVHVLQVDDPSKVNPEMGRSDAEQMTYYIDTEQYVPVRLTMQTKEQRGQNPGASTVTIDMKNYQTTDGLTLPHRMEMQFDANLSDQQRQQMKKAMEQMENMPEEQRKRMEKMMGDQMEMMKQMMSGDPIVVEVQSVQVNTELPDGVF